MKYMLEEALSNNVEFLIKCKLNSIFEYANNLSNDEMMKIKNYVNKKVPIQLKDYKLIKVDNKIIGCVLVEQKDDGVLLDEIYIEKDYRNKGIGTDIIKKILIENKIVFLWVYKLNVKAINLYKKCGFYIIGETETRYYMQYRSNNEI